MTDPWPRAETLLATRSDLLGLGAVVDGFRGRGVELHDEDVRVLFQWWSDQNTYGVRLPVPAIPAESPWTGQPVDSAAEWASGVSGWLMEELQTGLVRRAGRRDVDGVVELDPDGQRGWDVTGWYVSGSGSVTPARAMPTLGSARVTPVRIAQLVAGGRLISWLHAHVDDVTGSPIVGQAAVGWVTGRGGPASLDLVALDADAPASVGRMLAHHAVHDAAEAGATEVTTTLGHPWLHAIGFRPTPDGHGLVLDTRRLGL